VEIIVCAFCTQILSIELNLYRTQNIHLKVTDGIEIRLSCEASCINQKQDLQYCFVFASLVGFLACFLFLGRSLTPEGQSKALSRTTKNQWET